MPPWTKHVTGITAPKLADLLEQDGAGELHELFEILVKLGRRSPMQRATKGVILLRADVAGGNVNGAGRRGRHGEQALR